MICPWIAYDEDGKILAVIDYLVARDEDGEPIGLIDFDAHERAGGRMRDIADHQSYVESVPDDVFEDFMGRPREAFGESVALPPDHPYRLAHDRCKGSTTWPEWLPNNYEDFQVELDGNGRATAMVHRQSGHRRERAPVEAEIKRRMAKPGRADLRDLVGGPGMPLSLDENGRNAPRHKVVRPNLPVVKGGRHG